MEKEKKSGWYFKFSPGDYLRDTQCLSEKAQVAYDRIMCEHIRHICITYEQHKFFTKRLNEDELYELNTVLVNTPTGFQIEWVVKSILDARAYSESRSVNREGKKKKKSTEDMLTYVEHMDSNNNSNNNSIDLNKKEDTGEIFTANGSNPGIDNIKDYQLPEVKAGSVIVMIRVTQKKDVTMPDVYEMWEAFKIQHFTGERYYENENAIHSHFINWAKTQKFTDGNKAITNGSHSANDASANGFNNKNGGFLIIANALRNELAIPNHIGGQDVGPEI